MSERQAAAEETLDESAAIDAAEEHGALVRLLIAIRGSFLLSTIALGVVLIAAGVVLDAAVPNQGVLAAMSVIWGVSAILYGILGFGFISAIGYR